MSTAVTDGASLRPRSRGEATHQRRLKGLVRTENLAYLIGGYYKLLLAQEIPEGLAALITMDAVKMLHQAGHLADLETGP